MEEYEEYDILVSNDGFASNTNFIAYKGFKCFS